MLKQIVKVPIPNELLFDLLDKTTLKTDKYYLIDINCYKKIMFHKYHEPFLKKLRKHYYFSKLYYLDREFNYASFANIVRQICKSNNIMYDSKIIYHQSTYTIDYFIYYERELVTIQMANIDTPEPNPELSNTITLLDISRNISTRSYSL